MKVNSTTVGVHFIFCPKTLISVVTRFHITCIIAFCYGTLGLISVFPRTWLLSYWGLMNSAAKTKYKVAHDTPLQVNPPHLSVNHATARYLCFQESARNWFNVFSFFLLLGDLVAWLFCLLRWTKYKGLVLPECAIASLQCHLCPWARRQ